MAGDEARKVAKAEHSGPLGYDKKLAFYSIYEWKTLDILEVDMI